MRKSIGIIPIKNLTYIIYFSIFEKENIYKQV